VTGPTIAYNTFVVAVGVAAVGFAAGVVGSLCVLRKRALVGDAAAHATLVGVACGFLLTGRRDLATLLAAALVSAVAGLGAVVLLRRFTRTRDDAAIAIVIGVSFGLGITLVSGIPAWGYADSAGLEQFLLGHTAALTAADATLLAGVAFVAAVIVAIGLKEATLVAFDAAFAAASGWPVAVIDYLVVALVAVMVVAGLPAVGAVLVTALVVIPPVAARFWTERVGTMLVLAGAIGLVAALVGVAVSATRPGLATGPLVVLAAAIIFAVSFLVAPERGWIARRLRARALADAWSRGLALDACRRSAGAGDGTFTASDVEAAVAGDREGGRRAGAEAFAALVRTAAVAPVAGGRDAWRLTPAGRALAEERRRRLDAWDHVIELDPDDAREALTLDLPAPEAVLGREGGAA
jgi:manganese/zinc/iron transport system permease protein